jgi:Fe-S oxidoreductase
LGAKLFSNGRRPRPQVALFPHCHQRALWGTRADTGLLDLFEYRFRLLDVGCCGGAGKFGFLAKYNELSKAIYDVCVRCGIESLEEGTALVADGFSCSRRLADETGRAVYHTAELVAAALMDRYLEPGVEVKGR